MKMILKSDRERVKALLAETITLLCKNGLHFKSEFSVEALIGITLDQDDVFLVSIKETVKSDTAHRTAGTDPSEVRNDFTVIASDESAGQSGRRRPLGAGVRGATTRPRRVGVGSPRQSSAVGREVYHHRVKPEECGEEGRQRQFSSFSAEESVADDGGNFNELSSRRRTTTAEDEHKDSTTQDIGSETIPENCGDFDGNETKCSADGVASESRPDTRQSQETESSRPGKRRRMCATSADFEGATLQERRLCTYDGGQHIAAASSSSISESFQDVIHIKEESASGDGDAQNYMPALSEYQMQFAGTDIDEAFQSVAQPDSFYLSAAGNRIPTAIDQSLQAETCLELQRQNAPHLSPGCAAGAFGSFQCSLCPTTFSNRNTYEEHVRRHKNIYKYYCSYCGKGFSASLNLRGHLVKHTGVREFKCPVCSQEFTYKRRMVAHMKSAHQRFANRIEHEEIQQ